MTAIMVNFEDDLLSACKMEDMKRTHYFTLFNEDIFIALGTWNGNSE